MQQDVGPGHEVLGLGELGRVVTDPVDTGHKDHAGRAEPGQHLGVVTGAGREAPGAVAQRSRRRLDQADHAGIEVHGLETGQGPPVDLYALGGGELGQVHLQASLCLLEQGLVSIAEVDGQDRSGCDDVDQVGVQAQPPHRAHLARTHLAHHPAYEGRHGGGGVTGVVAVLHGRGPGVVRLPRDDQLLPGNALYTRDGADDLARPVQDGALLDVQLYVGVGHQAGARRRAQVADPLQLVAQAGAVDGDDVVGLLHAEATGVNEAAEHVGSEARPLLVGEKGHRHRTAGDYVAVVKRLQHLEAGQHPQVAVVDAARSHGVDVRPAHDRWPRLPPRPGGDHIADGVHGNLEAGVAHPHRDQVTALPVGVSQRQAGAATAVDGAHLPELAEPTDQAVGVDAERGGPGGGWHDSTITLGERTVNKSSTCSRA